MSPELPDRLLDTLSHEFQGTVSILALSFNLICSFVKVSPTLYRVINFWLGTQMTFMESIYKYVEQFPLLEEEDEKPSIRQSCVQNPKLLFRGICKSPARKHSELILSDLRRKNTL